MKISHLLSKLNESARFGNQQKALVQRHHNDFRIGIEYEFHVDMDIPEIYKTQADTSKVEDARMKAAKDNEVPQEIDFLLGIISSLNMGGDLLYAHKISREIYLNAVAKDPDGIEENITPEYTERYFSYFNILRAVDTLDSELKIAMSEVGLDSVVNHDVPQWSQVFSLYEMAVDAAQIGDIDTVDGVSDALGGIDAEPVFSAIEEIIETLEPYLENSVELVKAISAAETYEFDVTTYLRSYRRGARKPTATGETLFISDHIFNNSNVSENEIHAIVPDITVWDGAEVVTKALPMNDAFSLMRDMFDYIPTVGHTSSDKSGLHVNISHKSFADLSKFDPFKMTVLLDNGFMQSDNRSIIKWGVRNNYVKNVYDFIEDELKNPESLNGLMNIYELVGIEGVAKELAKKIVTDNKYQSINFTNILNDNVSVQNRRVEFRFFGGENYEDRYDEIVDDIYFLCYVILAGADKEFLRREYLTEIVRILNRFSMKIYNVTFSELFMRP